MLLGFICCTCKLLVMVSVPGRTAMLVTGCVLPAAAAAPSPASGSGCVPGSCGRTPSAPGSSTSSCSGSFGGSGGPCCNWVGAALPPALPLTGGPKGERAATCLVMLAGAASELACDGAGAGTRMKSATALPMESTEGPKRRTMSGEGVAGACAGVAPVDTSATMLVALAPNAFVSRSTMCGSCAAAAGAPADTLKCCAWPCNGCTTSGFRPGNLIHYMLAKIKIHLAGYKRLLGDCGQW